jgi:hypothetical protein
MFAAFTPEARDLDLTRGRYSPRVFYCLFPSDAHFEIQRMCLIKNDKGDSHEQTPNL